jgi:pimeloyl-ACP methyl ester carboxylesterase
MARWDQGGESPVPDWFWAAVETESEKHFVEVEECDVFYQRWPGQSGRPLLLIHGMNAHSRWWDFIAPQLTDAYRVAAMDLTGMGDSDYRYAYDAETYAQEIVGVCDAAGFGSDVLIVAHSFGGVMATKAANLFPERFGGLVLVDSGLRHPDEPVPDYPAMGGGRAKAYPDRDTAEARFRLFPPQPCANDYILKYIAKQSLMRLDGGNWAWKFDEELPLILKGGERAPADYAALSIPVGIIYGERSASFSRRTLEHMLSLLPGDVPVVEVADAQHHVFLDQPLAFVEALGDVAGKLGDQKLAP